MKKIFIIAAAVATLAACQKNSSVEIVRSTTDDNAIGFSAYTATAVTKGTVVDANKFKEDGIGVFAFYQPANNGVAGPNYTTVKYPTPDFMYNQKVTIEGTTWTYTPIKYWPNNTNDKVSFFAYAPYKGGTSWEDLAFSTDATGNKVNKTFVINNAIDEQVDYLFAEPVLNMAKPTGADVESDNGLVKFDFKHITSKVSLYVGVETDVNTLVAPTGTPEAWDDANTTIEVKSIEFKDLAQTFTWTKKAGDDNPTFTFSGTQNIVAKPYTRAATYQQVASDAAADGVSTYCDDALGTNPTVPSAGTAVPDKYKVIEPAINYGLISNGWTAEWHRFLKGETPVLDPDTNEYMFIAPQTLSTEEIVITYVVRTTDAADANNNSTVTNVIKKTWADFRTAEFTAFESGKQYNLYFLIGMESVKLAATASDWLDGTEHVIDVPVAY